jgi:hypothetical protein
MKKLITIILLLMISIGIIHAQTGNIGFGTSTPGSKLTVNGSFAAAYTSITATTYTAGENDFYIVWNGTAAGTITLPASSSGPNRTGRLYFFKNTSGTYTLTLDAAGTELIDNAQTVLLQPGETGLLVKTNVNTASGATYEVVQVSKAQPGYTLVVAGGAQTFPDGTFNKSNFTAVEYSTNGGADFNLATSVWTCPQTGVYKIHVEGQGNTTVVGNHSHAGLFILKNGGNITGQYFFISSGPANSGSVTAIANLVAGDQITVSVAMCSGCGTGMSSTRRRLEIVRL